MWYEMDVMDRTSEKARGMPGNFAKAAKGEGACTGGACARSVGGP